MPGGGGPRGLAGGPGPCCDADISGDGTVADAVNNGPGALERSCDQMLSA